MHPKWAGPPFEQFTLWPSGSAPGVVQCGLLSTGEGAGSPEKGSGDLEDLEKWVDRT